MTSRTPAEIKVLRRRARNPASMALLINVAPPGNEFSILPRLAPPQEIPRLASKPPVLRGKCEQEDEQQSHMLEKVMAAGDIESDLKKEPGDEKERRPSR